MVKRVFNMQNGAHSAAAYTAFENAAYGSCVANANSLKVSAASGMTVHVAPGDGIIGTPNSGKRIQSDAVETVTVSAANATFNRIDSVVVYIDSAVAPTTAVIDNVNNILKFAVVAGTASGNPVAPNEATVQAAIGAGNSYMVLADIIVPSGVTSVNTATFIDRRHVATLINSSNLAKKAVKVDNIDFATIPMFSATIPEILINLDNTQDVIIPYTVKEYDTAAMYNVSTYKATVPVRGVYHIHARCQIASAGFNTNASALIKLFKNDSQFKESMRTAGTGNQFHVPIPTLDCDVLLNAGDVIDARARCTDSRNFGGNSMTSEFNMRLIAEMP